MNATLMRMFPLWGEKLKLQLQGEAYNLTNTVVFNNPGGNCCWITGTSGAVNYNNFGIINSTVSTPRYLVVAAYLRF